MVPAGNYRGKAVSGEFGTSSQKKTDFVAVQFQIVGGPHEGQSVFYTGYFTEKTTDRTLESLKFCGCTFPENDITNLTGLGNNIVPIVVEHQTYQDEEGNQKTSARVSWVNNPMGAINPESQMDAAAKAAFRAKMLGKVASMKGTNGAKTESKANVPF